MHDELVKILPQPRATVYSDLGANGLTTPSTGPIEWLRRSNSFPNYVSFRDAKMLIARLRMVKDAGELQMIAHASDASVAAHLAALKAIHPNVNEREISALMQYEFGKRGCERPAYAPIVGSGFYSTVLHTRPTTALCKPATWWSWTWVASSQCMPRTSRARRRSAASSQPASAKFMTSCLAHSRRLCR